jgi:hypothetical protein
MILRVPNGLWRPDTVITDWDGNEIFVLLDQTNSMGSYEAVFGDLDGRRLACVKRHLLKAFWKDGYYFCTYKPNYPGQKHLEERDVDNKKLYPFSYLQCIPMKGRFFYRVFDRYGTLDPPRLRAQNPWIGFMNVCCTPFIRFGRWTVDFKTSRTGHRRRKPLVRVDQWKNTVTIAPGQDLLAALCIAYVFDRLQNQPMVTVFGKDDDDLAPDDASFASSDDSEAPYINSGSGLADSKPKIRKHDPVNERRENRNDGDDEDDKDDEEGDEDDDDDVVDNENDGSPSSLDTEEEQRDVQPSGLMKTADEETKRTKRSRVWNRFGRGKKNEPVFVVHDDNEGMNNNLTGVINNDNEEESRNNNNNNNNNDDPFANVFDSVPENTTDNTPTDVRSISSGRSRQVTQQKTESTSPEIV